MQNKTSLQYHHIQAWVWDLARAMVVDQFKPELIIGVARGGLVPAVMLSHQLEIPMQSLHWSTRHDHGMKNGVIVAEDIVYRRVLIIDDIVDSGKTFIEIKEHLPVDSEWSNVKFAALQKRHDCKFEPDYYADIIEDETWQVYPWET